MSQIWERELRSGPNPARLQHGGGAQPEGGRSQQAATRPAPFPHSVQGGGRSGASVIRPSAAGRGNTSVGRLALMKTAGNLVQKFKSQVFFGGGGGSIVSPELYLISSPLQTFFLLGSFCMLSSTTLSHLRCERRVSTFVVDHVTFVNLYTFW